MKMNCAYLEIFCDSALERNLGTQYHEKKEDKKHTMKENRIEVTISFTMLPAAPSSRTEDRDHDRQQKGISKISFDASHINP